MYLHTEKTLFFDFSGVCEMLSGQNILAVTCAMDEERTVAVTSICGDSKLSTGISLCISVAGSRDQCVAI